MKKTMIVLALLAAAAIPTVRAAHAETCNTTCNTAFGTTTCNTWCY